MELGDTFELRNDKIDPHLWIVLSEPQQDAENVVIVNITTLLEWKDQSCILGPTDHPWIRHDSCVSYQDAKCVAESLLDSLVTSGQLLPQGPLSDDALRKVIEGAEATDAMPNKCRKVLADQGLIN